MEDKSEQKEKRMESLCNFINTLEDELDWDFDIEKKRHRFLLQKYVFIARFFGLDLGYYFDKYIYGPYSSDLADDYYDVLPNEERRHKFVYLWWEGKVEFFDLIEGKTNRWLRIASVILSLRENDWSGRELIERAAEIENENVEYVEKVYNELAQQYFKWPFRRLDKEAEEEEME